MEFEKCDLLIFHLNKVTLNSYYDVIVSILSPLVDIIICKYASIFLLKDIVKRSRL